MFGPPALTRRRALFLGCVIRHNRHQEKRPQAMIRLQAGALACELEPRLGGCIAGLWLGDVPVLRSTPAAQLSSARQAGCYPLVPFSNRIGKSTLLWQGTRHPLVRNNGTEPHAIHGIGWQRPWEVLESDERSALLSYGHRPDTGWPFAFDSSQTVQLRDGALALTLSLTNQPVSAQRAGGAGLASVFRQACAQPDFVRGQRTLGNGRRQIVDPAPCGPWAGRGLRFSRC
jgi:hypothetical protein